MIMAMRHGELPRTLHADQPSSQVDWAAGAIALLAQSTAWPETGQPRRAAVSSFGISGTNAHVILEQAPPAVVDAEPAPSQPAVPWVLSGRSDAAVRAQAARLAAHVTEHPELDAADVAYSLAGSRAVFEHRAVVVGTDRDELLAATNALADGDPGALRGAADVDGRTVFVFPGQGAQWVGMGARLLAESPVFAERIAECAAALAPFTDWSLLDVLREGRDLDRVDVVQPASFAVMVVAGLAVAGARRRTGRRRRPLTGRDRRGRRGRCTVRSGRCEAGRAAQ